MANVILTGFMGCGKSSIAVKLSYRLKKTVIDTDKWIEKKQGKTIAAIFAEDGEEAFRQMETDALKEIGEKAKNEIISVGGGTPLREENRKLLKEMGTVVYLRAKPETIYERIKADGRRPLLNCEDPKERIRELLEKRSAAYEDGANVIVDVDEKNFGQILFEIEQALRAERRAYLQREFPNRPYQRKSEWRSYGQREYSHREYGQRLYGSREYGENRRFDSFKKEERPEESAQQTGQTLFQAQPLQPQSQLCQTQQQNPEGRLKKLLVINGPNLNFLGIREKDVYGTQDYNALLDMIAKKGVERRAAIDVYQSNHEGAIIDRIQAAYFDGTEGIVINPGAYSHYSYAIRDALASISVPKIEVHISNIMEREAFRRISVTAPACSKQIYGQGLDGYLQAIDLILDGEF